MTFLMYSCDVYGLQVEMLSASVHVRAKRRKVSNVPGGERVFDEAMHSSR